MKTQGYFYFTAIVAILTIIPLFYNTTISATASPVGSYIPFYEHIVDAPRGSSVHATDIDGDEDVDLLAPSCDGSPFNWCEVIWWENDGSENFANHHIAWLSNVRSVYAADVDDDEDVDVLVAADDRISWRENDGSEDFSQYTSWMVGSAQSVYATDVDGDGDTDILGAASSEIAWWENDGSEHFTAHTISDDFSGARSVYAIDLDGDEDVDVLGAASLADDITWWENDGSESFTAHAIDGNFDGAGSVYATDVDGDDDVDVLGASITADDITWWENDGSESFSAHTIAGGFPGARSVYATDVDGDGDVDVLGAARNSRTAWWEQGTPLWPIFLPVVSRNAGPPETPVLHDISNPDGYYHYTVSWSEVGGATAYTLEEANDAAFSSPTVVYSGADTSKYMFGQSVGTYYYRVRASNRFGESDWSDVKATTVTEPPPPCPQIGSWSGSTGQGYDVVMTVADAPDCHVDYLEITYRYICIKSVNTTTYVVGLKTYRDTPISYNYFELYDSSTHLEVTGDFTSATSASGRCGVSSFYDPEKGHCFGGHSDWTATYSP
jgi:hypothetical protein